MKIFVTTLSFQQVWRDWAIERNSRANLSGKSGRYEIVPLDIKDATVEMMSYWLPLFITEVNSVTSTSMEIIYWHTYFCINIQVRRRDKRPYPPDTLMQIASGLQRHLRHVSGRSDITFFDKYSPTFAQFREALKARSDAINSKLSNTRRGKYICTLSCNLQKSFLRNWQEEFSSGRKLEEAIEPKMIVLQALYTTEHGALKPPMKSHHLSEAKNLLKYNKHLGINYGIFPLI